MLADIGDNYRIAIRNAVQLFDHLLGIYLRLRILAPERHRIQPAGQLRPPLLARCFASVDRRTFPRFKLRGNTLQGGFGVRNKRNMRLFDLADIRWIDVDVDNLRLRCKGRELARNAVIKPHADCDKQIGFRNAHVRRISSMHAEHTK